MVAIEDLTEAQRKFARNYRKKVAFIGSRQVGHTEAIAFDIARTLQNHDLKIALIAPTEHQKREIIKRVAENLPTMTDFEYDKYFNSITNDDGAGVFPETPGHFSVSEYAYVYIDNVDSIDDFRSIDSSINSSHDTSFRVAGTPKIPSQHMNYILNDNSWNVVFDDMENCELVDAERVKNMRETLGVSAITEVDGMIVTDPRKEVDYL